MTNLVKRKDERSRKTGLASSILAITFALCLFQPSKLMASELKLNNDEKIGFIEKELLQDPATPSYLIDVSIKNDMVYLDGTVNNLLEKERAENIAETVKGLLVVVNNLEVEPIVQLSDSQIRSRILSSLATNPATDFYEIFVSVTDGDVHLHGNVESWQEKNISEKLAMDVSGVRSVVNLVQVKIPDERPDHEILNDVQEGLRWDTIVDNKLTVLVDDSEVTLEGMVDSIAEKNRAIMKAWVVGVKSVDADKLTINQDTSTILEKVALNGFTDDDLKKAIESTMILDPSIDESRIDILVSNGEVRLRGNVSNLQTRNNAANKVRSVYGVERVINNLKIRTQIPRTDYQLKNEISNALVFDPYVEKYEVDVSVNNGVTKLQGIVDTTFEKAQAHYLASGIDGVRKVKNQLTVIDDIAHINYNPYVYDWHVYDYPWYNPIAAPFGPIHKPDGIIEDDVRSELFWSPYVDSDSIEVDVNDGIASLNGTVNSVFEMNSAVSNAMEGGAIGVKNFLVIQ